MNRFHQNLALLPIALAFAIAWGQDLSSAVGQPPSFENAATQARQSIVTVRVVLPIPEDENKDPLAEDEEPRNRVTVCTGIAVDKRLIVTSAFASADAAIRVTTPMGGRDEARLRVLDEYSGLMLIETNKLDLIPVPRAEMGLEAGSWVLGAAGWGAEPPVISFGVISGVDRQQPGYPPLLQCDLRTVDTSSGAALLDIKGRLQGVVVAVDNVRPQGLTYAVPVRHVERLLRTWDQKRNEGGESREADGDNPPAEPPTKAGPSTDSDRHDVVILRRGRPEAGLVLQGNVELNGDRQILVQRVRDGSPAQRAGFTVGDEVLSVDGVQIRSVYEAVRPVLNRQPGDTLTYRISNNKGIRDVTLVLGGGVAVSSPNLATVSNLVRPKLDIEGLPGGIRTFTNTSPRNLAGVDGDEVPKTTAQKQAELLQRAIDGYQKVIELQQDELRKAKQARLRDEAMLEELRKQIEALQRNAANK